ncbi:hypothetical protein BJ508DRAFT_214046, partial [Ascobolus immersus RN42]
KTYSTKDSRVVTHRSTNLAIRSLTMGERTGSRIFFNLWPYVTVPLLQALYTSNYPELAEKPQNKPPCSQIQTLPKSPDQHRIHKKRPR